MNTGRMLGLATVCASLVLLLMLGVQVARPVNAAPMPTPALGAAALQVATPNYPFAETEAISRAISYLATQQQPDGGIAGFGGRSDAGSTLRTLLALNVAGYAPDVLTSNSGNTPLDFLQQQAISYTYIATPLTTSNLLPGRAGLLLMGLAASGENPANFAGQNWVAAVQGSYQPVTGAYSTTAQQGFSSGAANPINQSFAILGLSMAGEPVPAQAISYLISTQDADGSWFGSVDVTGYAVLALLASGQTDATNAAVQNARRYLAGQQASSGLWGDESGAEPANSTGWAMQALGALGYIPATESLARAASPRAALLALQGRDGSIGKNFVNAFSTIEAIYGLSDQPLWFSPRLRALRALTWLEGQQRGDGGWGFFGSSDAGQTLDALFAFTSSGFDPASVQPTGGVTTALDYLEGAAFGYTRDGEGRIFPAQTGKLIVGVVAAGRNPNAFGADPTNVYPDGLPLVQDLERTYNPATGAYSSTAEAGFNSGAASPINQALAILGLAAAKRPIPGEAVGFLVSLQQPNGSWGGIDTTGLVLQALIAGGAGDVLQVYGSAVERGANYLLGQRDALGGWGNANSNAYALQGLRASGRLVSGRTPLAALQDFQKFHGPFVYAWDSPFLPPDDNGFATNQAIPALVGAVYPYSRTGVLQAFAPVGVGSNADRLVASTPRFRTPAGSVQVTIPFGSDQNANASASITYVLATGSTTGTVTLTQQLTQTVIITPGQISRGSGFFSHTLTLKDGQRFVGAEATVSDSDRIEVDGQLLAAGQGLTLPARPQRVARVYLPIVIGPPAP